MSSRIDILDINIDLCTAKEAMKVAVECIESDPVNVIEFATVDSVMQMSEIPELKQEMDSFELVLPGEKTILDAAGVTDKKIIQ